MLADVRLIIGTKEARLTVRHGDDIVEDELWKFDRHFGREEAKGMVEAIFSNAYDMLNFVTHGDD
jgi:hypothetical protein